MTTRSQVSQTGQCEWSRGFVPGSFRLVTDTCTTHSQMALTFGVITQGGNE